MLATGLITYICLAVIISLFLRLIQALKGRNDKENFISLINEHNSLIYKVCNTYCQDATERQDMFQEIIIQLWKSYPQFRGEAKFTTWMYRIALNTAISALRKKRLYVTPLETATEALSEIPVEATETKEQQVALHKAINQLSAVEKAIVMMYLDDKSYEEMEEVFGISQNTLRVKMNRIKEKLRKLTQVHSYGT